MLVFVLVLYSSVFQPVPGTLSVGELCTGSIVTCSRDEHRGDDEREVPREDIRVAGKHPV